MNRSNIVFGTLILAFVIFVTLKGELPSYLALFKSSPQGASGGASTSSSSATVASPTSPMDLSGILNNANGEINNILSTIGLPKLSTGG